MFEKSFISEIAKAVAAEVVHSRSSRGLWPELMSLETAAEYMDRSSEGVRLLVKKKLIPTTRIDGRVQLRKVDIDRLIERKTA